MRTDKARMTFARLDRPATADDVRRTLAIFSLEGEGATRLWPSPEFPMNAKWVALKDYPSDRAYYDPKKSAEITRLEYEQDGLVWQAEEVLKGGRWERHYGFVGKYVVAKVPAAEIEFPADRYRWRALSGGIDCRVSPPGQKREGDWITATRFGVGAPLDVTVRLRNRSGVDRNIPALLWQDDAQRGPSLRAGVNVSLRYSPERVSSQGVLTPISEDENDWREIEPKVTAHFAAGAEESPLAAAEEIDAFTLDLNKLFEITKPGSYRLKFVFTKDSGLGEGKSKEVTFSLAPAKENTQ